MKVFFISTDKCEKNVVIGKIKRSNVFLEESFLSQIYGHLNRNGHISPICPFYLNTFIGKTPFLSPFQNIFLLPQTIGVVCVLKNGPNYDFLWKICDVLYRSLRYLAPMSPNLCYRGPRCAKSSHIDDFQHKMSNYSSDVAPITTIVGYECFLLVILFI